MKQTIATALMIAAAFGTVYGVEHSARVNYQHAQCIEKREARDQGNTRVRHLKLVEGAIIVSNEKAQAQIKGYSYPKAVKELKEEDVAHPTYALPPVKC